MNGHMKVAVATVAAAAVLFVAATVPLPHDRVPPASAPREHVMADDEIELASIGCAVHQLTANGIFGPYLLYQMKVEVTFCWWDNQLPRNPDGSAQIRSIKVWFTYLAGGVTPIGGAWADQMYWINRYSAWHERVRAWVNLCSGACPVFPSIVMHVLAGGGLQWSVT